MTSIRGRLLFALVVLVENRSMLLKRPKNATD